MPSQTLQLPQRLTQAQAAGCWAALSQRLRAGGCEAIDASALLEFDSSALAVLLALQRQAHQAGTPLRVHGLPARLQELVALYGVGELLPA